MNQVSLVSRRSFVLGTGGLAALLALPQAASANEWQAALEALVGTIRGVSSLSGFRSTAP